MFALRILLAAGSISLINGAPVSSFVSELAEKAPLSHSLQSRSPGTYVQVFSGDGAVSEGWPATNQWTASFDDMFTASRSILENSCSQYAGSPANNSPAENDDLKKAIETVAGESGIDPRYIFAIVMQESNGCVRAPTTNYGVRNPGLMQSHNGAGTCNDASVTNPCPLSQITIMIRDGTEGTPSGDGLKQLLAKAGSGDNKYYVAARMYNSGSVAASGNLGDGIATHCYATDIANRLVGWSIGPTSCDANTIGSSPILHALFKGAVSSPTVESPVVDTPSATTQPAVPNPSAGVFVETPADPTTTAAAVATPTPVDTIDTTPTTGTTGTTIAEVSPPEPDLPVVTSGTGSTLTAGSPCTTEGEWNCIGGSSFQQCASGVWSVVQNLAEGTVCQAGKSAAIQITNARSKRRHLSHGSSLHIIKHARHASF